jgi:dTDP-4-dehydrorhamnose 3,5-epimerase
MRFIETKLKGAFIIEPEKLEDERGFFARSFCRNEFKEHGLNDNLAQCNISFNKSKGTMRGMHLQVPPKAEAKLVRCTMGAIYDVIVDLQKDSSTYKKHIGVTLTPENRKMLYVPEGFVHGFITLEDNTEVFYQMSEFYAPEFTIGYRWNDPAFNIDWPIEVKVISDRDRDYPDFT